MAFIAGMTGAGKYDKEGQTLMAMLATYMLETAPACIGEQQLGPMYDTALQVFRDESRQPEFDPGLQFKSDTIDHVVKYLEKKGAIR